MGLYTCSGMEALSHEQWMMSLPLQNHAHLPPTRLW